MVAFFQPLQVLLVVGVGGVEGDANVVGQTNDTYNLINKRSRRTQFIHYYNSDDAENELVLAFWIKTIAPLPPVKAPPDAVKIVQKPVPEAA